MKFVGGIAFPDPHSAIAISTCEQNAVVRKIDGGDPIGVFPDRMDHFAGFRIPQFKNFRGSSGRDEIKTGSDVSGEHGVKFLSRAEQASPGGHIEGHRDAGFAGNSATHDEVTSVRAKGERHRFSFGKGQNTNEFQSLRVMQQNLPLPRDGQQRCPW